jgi:L-ascorbate metabolism protein UlaG (beta-lactamase superfamily)
MSELVRTNGDTLVEAMRARPPDGSVRLWWLGQSGFAIRYRDDCLLVDPYLSESLTTKYAGTDTPHVRLHPRILAPEELVQVPITAVLSTHHHTDHLDPDTLKPILDVSHSGGQPVRVVVPETWRDLAAERIGVEPTSIVGMDEGKTIQIGAFEVVAVAAAHETVEYDARGRRKCLGYLLRSSAATIYHAGDTLLYEGQAARIRPYAVDIALLPINGKVGNMSGADAAQLAHAAGVGLAVPCHYDMFEFNTADPAEEFVPECESRGQKYKVLTLGELLTWPLDVARP